MIVDTEGFSMRTVCRIRLRVTIVLGILAVAALAVATIANRDAVFGQMEPTKGDFTAAGRGGRISAFFVPGLTDSATLAALALAWIPKPPEKPQAGEAR
jgi:hypothetical protein